MNRNKTATQHSFAVVPRTEIPRSRFPVTQTRKMGFNASELIPIMCEEVLPGDTWQHSEAIAARLATPIAPVVDDLYLETFYFWVANRIGWESWEDFITGTNTNLTIPVIGPIITGVSYELKEGSVFDHFGLLPQVYSVSTKFNALPIWAYFNIYNEWFRDENLQDEWTWSDSWVSGYNTDITQGATLWQQMPLRANKKPDYFTKSLPWAQKGAPVSLPLGTTAPVIADTNQPVPYFTGTWAGPLAKSGLRSESGVHEVKWAQSGPTSSQNPTQWAPGYISTSPTPLPNTGLVADLSYATAASLNSLRLAATMQQLLERDARGGSRYVENLIAHWGTRLPDYTAHLPVYLGGGKYPVTVNPIAQTAAYDSAPDDDPSAVGNLGAEMHVSGGKRTFTFAAQEHGYIIGLCVVRSQPTYQQGTRRHWRRQTRLEFYDPVFANIGEQAVATQEIYQPADNAPSNATWGYQERGGEYRYTPNEITGVLRSTAALPMDWWHYSEEFGTEPALNASFITDKTQEVLARSLATAPTAQWACQIIMDINHRSNVARLMPAYAVPGIDRF